MKSILAKEGIPFTQVPNELINDMELSDLAIRVYVFMASKPDGWNFTLKSMATQMCKSNKTVGNAVKELRESGWVKYSKKKGGGSVYALCTSPKRRFYDLPNLQVVDSTPCKIDTLSNLRPISNTDIDSNTDLNSNKDKMENYSNSPQKEKSEFENLAKRKFNEVAAEFPKEAPPGFSKKEALWYKTALAFFEVFSANLSEKGVPLTHLERAGFKQFIDPIRLMYEKDGLERSHMVKLWEFLKVDEFWKSNIQGTPKLRQQFTQLLMKSTRNGQRQAENREPQYSGEFIQRVIDGLGSKSHDKSA